MNNILRFSALALAAVLSTGCAVNVIVAPHATFAVESLNEANQDRPAYESVCQFDEATEACAETVY